MIRYCHFCGKKIERKIGDGNNHFCSEKCYKEHIRELGRVRQRLFIKRSKARD